MRCIAVSIAVSVAAVLCAGCRADRTDRRAPAPASEEIRAPQPGARAPVARPGAPTLHAARPPNWEGPWRPGQTREGPDLRATYTTDGRIQLTGRDRWGRRIDTTFESPRFFGDAIPALARSLTDEQAMRLRQLVYLLAEP